MAGGDEWCVVVASGGVLHFPSPTASPYTQCGTYGHRESIGLVAGKGVMEERSIAASLGRYLHPAIFCGFVSSTKGTTDGMVGTTRQILLHP